MSYLQSGLSGAAASTISGSTTKTWARPSSACLKSSLQSQTATTAFYPRDKRGIETTVPRRCIPIPSDIENKPPSANSIQDNHNHLDSLIASSKNFMFQAQKVRSLLTNQVGSADLTLRAFDADKVALEKAVKFSEQQMFQTKGITTNTLLGSRSTSWNKQNRQSGQDTLSSDQLKQIVRENRELKTDLGNLQAEISKVSAMKAGSKADQNLLEQLSALKRQITDSENKAAESKANMKKLQSNLSLREKELEQIRKAESSHKIEGMLISELKKIDPSEKIQGYLDFATKETKLKSVLQKEQNPSKTTEIQEMIVFLKSECADIISHFASIFQGAPNPLAPPIQGDHSTHKQAQQQHQSRLFNSTSGPFFQQESISQSNGFNESTINGFSKTNGTQGFYKTASKLERNPSRDEKLSRSSSPMMANSNTHNSINQQRLLEQALREQVETVKKSYLDQFVQMLGEIDIEMNIPSYEDTSEEQRIVLTLRREFAKMATQHNGHNALVGELRDRIKEKEKELSLKTASLEQLKTEVAQKQELIEANPKAAALEEQVSKLKEERKQKKEQEKALKSKVVQLEKLVDELQQRESTALESTELVKNELFDVLNNLKSVLEAGGLLNTEERDVAQMLDKLSCFFSDKVHLHREVFGDMERKILEQEKQIEEMVRNNAELREEINAGKLQRDLGDQEKMVVQEQVESLKNLAEETRMELQRKTDSMVELLADLNEKETIIEQLNDQNNQAFETIRTLQDQVYSKNLELERAATEHAKGLRDLESEKLEKNRRAVIVASLENFQVAQRERNEDLVERLNVAEKELEGTKRKLREAEDNQEKIKRREQKNAESHGKSKQQQSGQDTQIEEQLENGRKELLELEETIRETKRIQQVKSLELQSLEEQLQETKQSLDKHQQELQQAMSLAVQQQQEQQEHQEQFDSQQLADNQESWEFQNEQNEMRQEQQKEQFEGQYQQLQHGEQEMQGQQLSPEMEQIGMEEQGNVENQGDEIEQECTFEEMKELNAHLIAQLQELSDNYQRLHEHCEQLTADNHELIAANQEFANNNIPSNEEMNKNGNNNNGNDNLNYIEELKNHINELNSNIEELNSHGNEQNQKVEELTAMIHETMGKNEELNQINENMLNHINELNNVHLANLAGKDRIIENLSSQIAEESLKKIPEKKDASDAQPENDVQMLIEEKEALAAQNESLIIQINELRDQIQQLEDKVHSKNEINEAEDDQGQEDQLDKEAKNYSFDEFNDLKPEKNEREKQVARGEIPITQNIEQIEHLESQESSYEQIGSQVPEQGLANNAKNVQILSLLNQGKQVGQQQPSEVQSQQPVKLKLQLGKVKADSRDDPERQMARNEERERSAKLDLQCGSSSSRRAEILSNGVEEHLKSVIGQLEAEKNQREQDILGLQNDAAMMKQEIDDQQGYIKHLEAILDSHPEILNNNQAEQQTAGNAPLNQGDQVEAARNNTTTNTNQQANKDNEILLLRNQIDKLSALNKELANANEELEECLEEKEQQLKLDNQEHTQTEQMEEQIGKLNGLLEKEKEKSKRFEEDCNYLSQVIQNQNKKIEEFQLNTQSRRRKSSKNNNGNGKKNQETENDSEHDVEGGLVSHLVQGNKQQPSFNSKQQNGLKEKEDGEQVNEEEKGSDNTAESNQSEESKLNFQLTKELTTQEAQFEEQQLINDKISLQQQIEELRSEFGQLIPTEDQLRIQELEKLLEKKKKRIEQLAQRMKTSSQSKPYQEAALKSKYLELQQSFKDLKEEKERQVQENKNLENNLNQQAMLIQKLQQQIGQSSKIALQSSLGNTSEQIDMLKVSLSDMQNQLSSIKSKYSAGVGKLKLLLEAPSFRKEQQNDSEQDDICALAEQFIALQNTKIAGILQEQQEQQQMLNLQRNKHPSQTSSHSAQNSQNIQKQPQISNALPNQKENNDDDSELSQHYSPVISPIEDEDQVIAKRQAAKLKAYESYSLILERFLDALPLGRKLEDDGKLKQDLLKEQLRKVGVFYDSLTELQKELNRYRSKNSNINSLKGTPARTPPTSNQKEPFQINDFETIKQESPPNSSKKNKDKRINENKNNDDNDSSFLSMSEQIVKELEAASNPKQQGSMAQQIQQQKIKEEDVDKLIKENSELKASKDFFASKQDELIDELKSKDEFIINQENNTKLLKKEIRKLRENTEAVTQKEQLKTIFIQFLCALHDKKKVVEAENFLNIIFSMLGVADREKEEMVKKLAEKQADKKKSIVQLLMRK